MVSTPLRRDDLGAMFQEYERSSSNFLIGAESEKFGVHEKTGLTLGYGGEYSVCQVFSSLQAEHGWEPIVETEGGPIIGLKRGGASITLEPAAQLELSGEPLVDLHAIFAENQQHLREIKEVTERLSIAWLATGFHPLARLSELSWVPKLRYPIMREYLPQKGAAGLDMMQRTATVQGNFDWSSEEDAMSKLTLALKLSPLMQAWFSNAPFIEGRQSERLSERARVWRHMDPSRSGLIESLWSKRTLRYQDYADWAISAGMFLIKREGKIVKNTGQPFADFLQHGFEGHQATLDDWKLHLGTLFPEARLKNTLEVRAIDSLPPNLAVASLAVWTGLFYDSQALDEALDLVEPFTFDAVEAQRDGLVARGLHAPLLDRSGFEWAERLFEIAAGGLLRRARVNDEGRAEDIYLESAGEILHSRTLPAERVIRRVEAGQSLIDATRIAF